MYTFEKKSGRYRDQRTGTFVPERKVYDAMEDRIRDGRNRLRQTIDLVYNKSITVENGRSIIISELRKMHVQMGVLGAGGRKSINSDRAYARQVYGRVGVLLREEYKYLDRLFQDVGTMSRAQALSRISMYADKVWTSYHIGEQQAKIRAGFTKKRRIAKDDKGTCEECSHYAEISKEGVPITDNQRCPLPGERSRCRGRCRCEVEYF